MSYIYIEKLKHIHFICHKILPLSYDESLSYYEVLCKVTDELNKVIDEHNIMIDNVDLLNNSVLELNTRVEHVEGEIEGFEDRINQAFIELKNQINLEVDEKLHEVDLKLLDVDGKLQEVDLKLADVDTRISQLEARLNSEIEAFRVYMEGELLRVENQMKQVLQEALDALDKRFEKFSKDMQIYVQDEIRKALDKIPEITSVIVKDPVTGIVMPIQQSLNNMFIHSSVNAFTIEEKNKLNLSIDEKIHLLNKSVPKGYTIYEWLRYGKEFIPKLLDADRVKDFVCPHIVTPGQYNGEQQWIDKDVQDIWQHENFFNGITIEELASIGLTIEEVNNLNVSVYDKLCKGAMLFSPN